MKPYYSDNSVTIYHGDCREILPTLEKVDLVLTDPPYGISLETNYRDSRFANDLKRIASGDRHGWEAKKYPPIHGDDAFFDPSFLLLFNKVALFGANAFSEKLPSSYSWIVWDKRTDRCASNNMGDGEVIWCKGATFKSVRIFRHLWNGYQRDSEIGYHVHPTQKPVALIKFIVGFFDGVNSILDPFMGSGTTLRAAKDLNRKAIGIEIEEKYCEIAAQRMMQEVLDFGQPDAPAEVADGIEHNPQLYH